MKKITMFAIITMTLIFWLIIYKASEPEKDLPINTPLIIKSHLPGACKATVFETAGNIIRNASIVACRVQFYTHY
ncbi:hypothetical protein HS962_04945 [Pantoea sp. BIGb0393]|uniref:Uncharacterized protein n=1 Tax=Pantoea nemavictus TaxID=2726955 RepID=A0ABU8PPA3_9GAMM|nr:hypothetical protein [Pantoea nemavictus]MBA0035578.1 hypothetical protein [Pantoea nemavictus]